MATRYGLNCEDRRQVAPTYVHRRCANGAEPAYSSVLTEAEEAIAVAFRQRTLLPLDDVLGCLREVMPRLSRSALHRCHPQIEALFGGHILDRVCDAPCSGCAAAPSEGSHSDGIQHRLTKPYHPLRKLLPAVLAGNGSMPSPSGSPEPDSTADG